MRPLLALFLSLILALASQAAAVARSEMAGVSDQVICGQSGTDHVTLDASGHVIHARACQHCVAASAVADLSPAMATPARPIGQSTQLAQQPADRGPAARTVLPAVRGPPRLLV